MSRPTLSQAQCWRPDALCEAAEAWEQAAGGLQVQIDIMVRGVEDGRDFWTGSAAEVAHDSADVVAGSAGQVARALVAAAVAARDGAQRIALARDAALADSADVRDEGFVVADDGTVAPPDSPSGLLMLLTGGDADVARTALARRAAELTGQVQDALDRLGAADADAAHDIEEAFAELAPAPAATRAAGASPVGAPEVVEAWPSVSQDHIAAQIATMMPQQRQRLIDTMPHQVGNTDGVPWDMRIAANRVNVANAILDERRVIDRPDEDKLRDAVRYGFGRQAFGVVDDAEAERMWAVLHVDPALRAAAIAAHDRDANRRITFYQDLLGEVPDPGAQDSQVDRQILAFDPDRSSLIELTGDLDRATSVGVLVPGLNTTVEGSASNTGTARRFVTASGGEAAMITYLGGPFPTGNLATGVVNAADPQYALDMAPRLVAFSEDVDRTVGGLGRDVPVTYIGHSYGGSILGTAEAFGLTADRTLYVEAAGAGVGVDGAEDWHNRNPDVQRFSMTAPGDWIEAVQGIPFGPHGADPDEMDGVIGLDTGYYQDGRRMAGPDSHSDVINEPSDAWRNILAVITGGPVTLK